MVTNMSEARESVRATSKSGQVSDGKHVGSWHRDGEAWISEVGPRRRWWLAVLYGLAVVLAVFTVADRARAVMKPPHPRAMDVMGLIGWTYLLLWWGSKLVREVLARPWLTRVEPDGVEVSSLRGRRRVTWDEIVRIYYHQPTDDSVSMTLATAPPSRWRTAGVTTVVAAPVATALLAAARNRGVDVG